MSSITPLFFQVVLIFSAGTVCTTFCLLSLRSLSLYPESDTRLKIIPFSSGIPGCAKSALCKEILSAPGGLGDNRPLHSLMGDLIKGR